MGKPKKPKFNEGDEVMNTTGYKCYIERVIPGEFRDPIYEVSTAEEHDIDSDEPQTSPSLRWFLDEDEISHKL